MSGELTRVEQAAGLPITEPGAYEITDEAYHADPVPGGSLSVSGARKLLPPGCPAKYRHWVDHGQDPKPEFDIGKAAHKHILGTGPELFVIDADDWRTKAAKEGREAARAAGGVPLLTRDHDTIQAMAAALRAHPFAGALLQPGTGTAEVSLFWRHGPSVWRRARLDWLPHHIPGRRVVVADYKTTLSADPEHLSRAMARFGYAQQGAWYIDAVEALDLSGNVPPLFALICQEKDPPHLVTVCEPDPEALAWGRTRNEKAIDVYRQCKASGDWPGYAADVVSLPLPTWELRQLENAAALGAYDLEETR